MSPSNETLILQRVDEIAASQRQILDRLNGTPESPGLVVRVDRLEQAEGNRRWITHTAVGAAITAAVGALIAAFKR